MAIKISDIVVTTADTDVSWQGIRDNYSNWNDLKEFSTWGGVSHLSKHTPLTVKVGTPIKVIIAAVDIDWEYVSNNYPDWSAVKSDFTNWKSILNYH